MGGKKKGFGENYGTPGGSSAIAVMAEQMHQRDRPLKRVARRFCCATEELPVGTSGGDPGK